MDLRTSFSVPVPRAGVAVEVWAIFIILIKAIISFFFLFLFSLDFPYQKPFSWRVASTLPIAARTFS